jgi:hypothetical protein
MMQESLEAVRERVSQKFINLIFFYIETFKSCNDSRKKSKEE